MATIKVDRIKVKKQGNLLAYADITISGKIVIYGCRLVSSDKGEFVSLPQQKGSDDKYYAIVKCIDETLTAEIYSAIKGEYDREMGNIKANPDEPEPF